MWGGREKGAAMVGTLGKNSEFAEVDIHNENSLLMALKGIILLRLDIYLLLLPYQPFFFY